MEKILKIMRRLRGKNGCPWDRKQTLMTLRQCFVEEAYEIAEALASGRKEKMQEEIGDMLCAIGLVIALAEERKLFDKNAVIRRAERKMISRHPHVFGNLKARNAAEALKFFQGVKEAERKEKGVSLLEDLEKGLPALLTAQKIQKKAAQIGFDWKEASGVFEKIGEEIKELQRGFRRKRTDEIQEEIGDILFSVVNLARKVDLNAETALFSTNSKFIRRFERMERFAKKRGIQLGGPGCGPEVLEDLWGDAKKAERKEKSK